MLLNLDIRKAVSIGVISVFLANVIGPIPLAKADEFRLPAPGVMVRLSPPLEPPMLKGIKVHPDDPFRFDFILDQGDGASSVIASEAKQSQQEQLKQEATRLIKYFLAALTIPEKDLWVNLSPYEKDRIIPQTFGLTEMGRDLLAEDYMLKQITASLIYPEDEVGKKFWKRIYEEAEKKFGTTSIPVNTFNKVWIVPEKAVVYENAQAGTAYVVESKLKVMLDQDYLSMKKHMVLRNDVASAGADIIREIVIPELTKEVNEDKNFAQLRQVYNSLILAAWYKKKIKDSILSQVYSDKNKTNGLSSPRGDIEAIYQRYLQAFKKGVFNYIKEDPDPMTQEIVPRKYFSGGVAIFGYLDRAMVITHVPGKLPDAAMQVDVNLVPDQAMANSNQPKVEFDISKANQEFFSKSKIVKRVHHFVFQMAGPDGERYWMKKDFDGLDEKISSEDIFFTVARAMGVHVPDFKLLDTKEMGRVLVLQDLKDYVSRPGQNYSGIEEIIAFSYLTKHVDFKLSKKHNSFRNKAGQYVLYDLGDPTGDTDWDDYWEYFGQIDVDKLVHLISMAENLDITKFEGKAKRSGTVAISQLNDFKENQKTVRQRLIRVLETEMSGVFLGEDVRIGKDFERILRYRLVDFNKQDDLFKVRIKDFETFKRRIRELFPGRKAERIINQVELIRKYKEIHSSKIHELIQKLKEGAPLNIEGGQSAGQDHAMFSWEVIQLSNGNHSYSPGYSIGPFILRPLYGIEEMIKKSKVKNALEDKLSGEIKRIRNLNGHQNHQRTLFVSPISAVPGHPVDSYSLNTITAMISRQNEFKKSIVIDLGAGSGLLSLVALTLGASKVYLFEKSRVLANIAKGILEAQGYRKGRDFEILGSIEGSKQIISKLAAKNNGQRRIIELANLGPWEFYKTANQEALNIFKGNPIDLLFNSGYFRNGDVEKGSHWPVLKSNYYDLKRQGYLCSVVMGTTNLVLVAKREDKANDQAMTVKFETWFKGISPVRLERERAVLDTLEGLLRGSNSAPDQRALKMNAYAFNVLIQGGFVSKEDVPQEAISVPVSGLEYGVNKPPKLQYKEAVEWMLGHEQDFLTREDINNERDVVDILLNGINSRKKSSDGSHYEFKYGWEIRQKSVFALKMWVAGGAQLTQDEVNKIVRTILSNLDPNALEPDYDVRKESAEILKELIDVNLVSPAKLIKDIESKGVVENLLRGLSPDSDWGLRMQNAHALKALVASGLVSKEKGEKIAAELLRYLNTDLYGPVYKTTELYGVYNAFADTLNVLIAGKFVTGKEVKEIVGVLLHGFNIALAGGESRETKNEDALKMLIFDGLVSRDDVMKEIEKNGTIETLLRGLSPDFYGGVRKTDADALKTLIDSRLVPKLDRFTKDEIKEVFGRDRSADGFLSYYLRLLAILKDHPENAYQAFNWNTAELKELFQALDSLSRGAMSGDLHLNKINIKYILENILIRNSHDSFGDPEVFLSGLKDKMREVISDDPVRINIYTDTPASVNAAEKIVQVLSLEKDPKVNILHGRIKPIVRGYGEHRMVQVSFGNIPDIDMGAYGNSFDAVLPDSPSKVGSTAVEFGLQVIGAQRPLLDKFLESIKLTGNGDGAMTTSLNRTLTRRDFFRIGAGAAVVHMAGGGLFAQVQGPNPVEIIGAPHVSDNDLLNGMDRTMKEIFAVRSESEYSKVLKNYKLHIKEYMDAPSFVEGLKARREALAAVEVVLKDKKMDYIGIENSPEEVGSFEINIQSVKALYEEWGVKVNFDDLILYEFGPMIYLDYKKELEKMGIGLVGLENLDLRKEALSEMVSYEKKYDFLYARKVKDFNKALSSIDADPDLSPPSPEIVDKLLAQYGGTEIKREDLVNAFNDRIELARVVIGDRNMYIVERVKKLKGNVLIYIGTNHVQGLRRMLEAEGLQVQSQEFRLKDGAMTALIVNPMTRRDFLIGGTAALALSAAGLAQNRNSTVDILGVPYFGKDDTIKDLNDTIGKMKAAEQKEGAISPFSFELAFRERIKEYVMTRSFQGELGVLDKALAELKNKLGIQDDGTFLPLPPEKQVKFIGIEFSLQEFQSLQNDLKNIRILWGNDTAETLDAYVLHQFGPVLFLYYKKILGHIELVPVDDYGLRDATGKLWDVFIEDYRLLFENLPNGMARNKMISFKKEFDGLLSNIDKDPKFSFPPVDDLLRDYPVDPVRLNNAIKARIAFSQISIGKRNQFIFEKVEEKLKDNDKHNPGIFLLPVTPLHVQGLESNFKEVGRTVQSKALPDNIKGGIDLTPANMHLQTQNNGVSIKFQLDPALLEQLQSATGFVPVIINIQPLKSVSDFLGLRHQFSFPR